MIKEWIKHYNPVFILGYLIFKMIWNIWAMNDMTETFLRTGAFLAVGFYGCCIMAYIWYWERSLNKST